MYSEELLTVEKGHTETRDLILKQCETRQQQDLITDVFLLVAVVMRERCGAIRRHADVLWDTLIRHKNIQIFCFSCFGLFCNICIASILWYNGNGHYIEGGDYIYQDMFTSEAAASTARYGALVLLQIALTTSTLVCCILLYQRGVMYVQEKRHEWSGIDMLQFTKAMLNPAASSDDQHKTELRENLKSSYNLLESTHRYRLAIEISLHLIHPVIWLNEPSTQTLFRILQMAIFLRLYFVGNLAFLLSEAYQSRQEILDKNVELQGTGHGITLGLVMKIFYFTYPVFFTSILMTGTLVVLGFVQFLAERNTQPADSEFGTLTNAYWFSFVTFTTVGYGDLYPKSFVGRVVAAITGVTGILIITILVGVITNLAAASREQRFIQEYLERADSGNRCRDSAAAVIQAAYRYSKIRTGDMLMPWFRRKGHKANFLYDCMLRFRKDRWRFTKSISTAGDPVVDSKLNFVRSDIRDCVTLLDRHERAVTATIDNLHQRVEDILHVLDDR